MQFGPILLILYKDSGPGLTQNAAVKLQLLELSQLCNPSTLEAIPNNNLMMRRADLSSAFRKNQWYSATNIFKRRDNFMKFDVTLALPLQMLQGCFLQIIEC